MVKLRPVYVIPSKQWRFTEDGHTFTALTPQRLAEQVAAYRAANHLPPGEPVQEVIVALSKEHPQIACEDTAPAEAQETPEPVPEPDSLARSARAFVAARSNTGFREANSIDQMTRTKTCLACPHNVPVDWETKTKDLMLATAGTSLRETNLGACEVWGHHNALAIQIADDSIGENPSLEPPSFCWQKAKSGL